MSVRCYVLDVDGEPAQVRLGKPPEQLGDDELDAIRKVIRAARRLAKPGLIDVEPLERELAATVAQLDSLPAHHARRVPLERRIRHLSAIVNAARSEETQP